MSMVGRRASCLVVSSLEGNSLLFVKPLPRLSWAVQVVKSMVLLAVAVVTMVVCECLLGAVVVCAPQHHKLLMVVW